MDRVYYVVRVQKEKKQEMRGSSKINQVTPHREEINSNNHNVEVYKNENTDGLGFFFSDKTNCKTSRRKISKI